MAATNSAQKKLESSVLRGYKILLAIPTLEKGFPTRDWAYASMMFSAFLQHPIWT